MLMNKRPRLGNLYGYEIGINDFKCLLIAVVFKKIKKCYANKTKWLHSIFTIVLYYFDLIELISRGECERAPVSFLI